MENSEDNNVSYMQIVEPDQKITFEIEGVYALIHDLEKLINNIAKIQGAKFDRVQIGTYDGKIVAAGFLIEGEPE